MCKAGSTHTQFLSVVVQNVATDVDPILTHLRVAVMEQLRFVLSEKGNYIINSVVIGYHPGHTQ